MYIKLGEANIMQLTTSPNWIIMAAIIATISFSFMNQTTFVRRALSLPIYKGPARESGLVHETITVY